MRIKYSDIPLDREWAILHAKKRMDEIVFRYSAHEGLPFTFPEVKTVLEGYSVGGKKLNDIDAVLRIGMAVEKTIQMVENNDFHVCRATSDELHAILMKEDALTWGKLRHLQVGVSAGGDEYMPPPPQELESVFTSVMAKFHTSEDHVFDKAFELFTDYAKNQFYFDGNKRMGQLMMNGAMIDKGLFWTSIPDTKRLEFNQALTAMYIEGNNSKLKQIYTSELEHFYTRIAQKHNTMSR